MLSHRPIHPRAFVPPRFVRGGFKHSLRGTHCNPHLTADALTRDCSDQQIPHQPMSGRDS
jgi:hypothetical protein